jgi:carboxyl-terminal processing protease
MKYTWKTFLLFLVFTLIQPTFSFAREDPVISFFDDIWKAVQRLYVEEIPDTDVERVKCAKLLMKPVGIGGCLEDRYAWYFTEEELAAERESISGKFAGIGLHITQFGKFVAVVSPIYGSPAGNSKKFKARDIIVSVDKEPMVGKSVEYVASKIRGEKDTDVTIEIMRRGVLLEPITITRTVVEIQVVIAKDIDENTTYLKLTLFSETLPVQLHNAIFKRLIKNTPDGSLNTEDDMLELDTENKKFVIDLRNNPGGLLDSVKIATSFFTKDTNDIIVTTKSKSGKEVFRSSNLKDPFGVIGKFKDLQFVILINEATASASEIFAGDMRDWHDTLLIGTETFGKGSVQEFSPLVLERKNINEITLEDLKNSDVLKLTIAEYFVGNRETKINHIGLTPDHVVENPEIEFAPEDIFDKKLIDLNHDFQLIKALEVLRKLDKKINRELDTSYPEQN